MANSFATITIVALAISPILACGTPNPTCCTEFKVGATMGTEISGTADGLIAAQAVADVAGIASATLDDLTTACRAIAQDLDAPPERQDEAENRTDKRARLDAWCKLAVDAIAGAKVAAGGSLKIDLATPKCASSIRAKANCQAKCSGGAQCDVKATPPRCTGRKLADRVQGRMQGKGKREADLRRQVHRRVQGVVHDLGQRVREMQRHVRGDMLCGRAGKRKRPDGERRLRWLLQRHVHDERGAASGDMRRILQG